MVISLKAQFYYSMPERDYCSCARSPSGMHGRVKNYPVVSAKELHDAEFKAVEETTLEVGKWYKRAGGNYLICYQGEGFINYGWFQGK